VVVWEDWLLRVGEILVLGDTEMEGSLHIPIESCDLDGKEIEAWGQIARFCKGGEKILVCRKAINLLMFLLFFDGLFFAAIMSSRAQLSR
jgi:hypothetical protein